MSLSAIRRLDEQPGVRSEWETIRDSKVRHAQLQSDIALHVLQEEERDLQRRRLIVEDEIEYVDQSEGALLAHRLQARRWLWMFLFAMGICIGSAWWTVDWFMTLGWERTLLAVTLFVLPLIGWMVFLSVMETDQESWNLRRISAGISLVIILSSLTAITALGGARMMGVNLQEEIHQQRLIEQTGEDWAKSAETRKAHVARTKDLLNKLAMIAVIFLSIASEMAAGIAYHEYWWHWIRVRTALPFYDEHERILRALALNRQSQEKVRHRPQLLHERLTTRGLKQDRQKTSLARTVKWIVGIFLLLLILLVVVSASFAGTTGVLLDLSDSTTSMTFAKNLRAVEQVIRRITSTRSRIVVFGITKSSFNRHPLLDETSPAVRGRFAEYVEEWQLKTLRTWRMKQTAFKLDAAGSDIIGALARIALEFQEVPQGEKRLVLLSDMRQVGKGLNFERSVGKPERLIHGVEKQALIPNLNAVRVWILGVHTSGVDERQWLTIRKFWVGFLEKAGAKLEAFSPNRDLKEW